MSTKYGIVKTDHILFIASGAFSLAKPSDLMPELQGRFPIRVELAALTADDFRRILSEPQQRADQAIHGAARDRRRDARIHAPTASRGSPRSRSRSTSAPRTSARGACIRCSNACSTRFRSRRPDQGRAALSHRCGLRRRPSRIAGQGRGSVALHPVSSPLPLRGRGRPRAGEGIGASASQDGALPACPHPSPLPQAGDAAAAILAHPPQTTDHSAMTTVVPFKARGVRAELQRALDERAPMRILRERIQPGVIHGYVDRPVARFLPDRRSRRCDAFRWLSRDRDRGRQLARSRSRARVRRTRARAARRNAAACPTDFRLDDWAAIARSAAAIAPLISVNMLEDDEGEISYVGQLVDDRRERARAARARSECDVVSGHRRLRVRGDRLDRLRLGLSRCALAGRRRAGWADDAARACIRYRALSPSFPRTRETQRVPRNAQRKRHMDPRPSRETTRSCRCRPRNPRPSRCTAPRTCSKSASTPARRFAFPPNTCACIRRAPKCRATARPAHARRAARRNVNIDAVEPIGNYARAAALRRRPRDRHLFVGRAARARPRPREQLARSIARRRSKRRGVTRAPR